MMGYGIDIGASAVKIVAVQRTVKGFRVTGAGRRRVPGGMKPDELRPVLAKLVYETLGATDGRRVGVIGIGGRDVNLQVVTQPKTTPVNYRTLMRYELDQRKGAAGDLYADWCTLREPDAYFPQFLAMVGVGRRGYVDERLATATDARVEVRDAVPNPFALFAAYRQAYDTEGGTQLLIDIGAENIEMALVRGGRLIFARNVSTGSAVFDSSIVGQSGLSPEEAEARKVQYGNLGAPAANADPREEEVRPALRAAAGQLVGVIQSSVQFARTQLQDRELAIDKAYLSGGGARLRGLSEYLASALKMPVELLDPFRRLDARALEGVDEFRQIPSDMAIATGLALLASLPARDAPRLSIVPDVVRQRRAFFEGPLHLVVAAVIVAAALVAGTAAAFVRRVRNQAALDEFTSQTQKINERIDALERLEAEQREVVAKTQLLASHTLAGRGTIEAISRLRKALPEGVNVRAVSFVDMSERAQSPLPHARCCFHAPGRGLVIGAILKETDEALTLTTGETFAKAELAEDGIRRWTAPSRGVQIEGEIDEDVRDGASVVLERLKSQLEDASRGMTAQIPFQEASRDKPGWRTFRILLRFE